MESVIVVRSKRRHFAIGPALAETLEAFLDQHADELETTFGEDADYVILPLQELSTLRLRSPEPEEPEPSTASEPYFDAQGFSASQRQDLKDAGRGHLLR